VLWAVVEAVAAKRPSRTQSAASVGLKTAVAAVKILKIFLVVGSN
jgi:hypothetical protein